MDRDYVLIVNGRVQEHFHIPDGTPPLRERFHPELCSMCVETTGLIFQPPEHWLWDERTAKFAMPLAKDGATPLAPKVFGGENLREISGGERLA